MGSKLVSHDLQVHRDSHSLQQRQLHFFDIALVPVVSTCLYVDHNIPHFDDTMIRLYLEYNDDGIFEIVCNMILLKNYSLPPQT